MIKYSEIENLFSDKGIEIHEYNIELVSSQQIETPIVIYTRTNEDSFEADGINFMNFVSVTLALIDETRNIPMQNLIQSVLYENDTTYDKSTNFDDEERLYSVSYIFTVIDDETDTI